MLGTTYHCCSNNLRVPGVFSSINFVIFGVFTWIKYYRIFLRIDMTRLFNLYSKDPQRRKEVYTLEGERRESSDVSPEHRIPSLLSSFLPTSSEDHSVLYPLGSHSWTFLHSRTSEPPRGHVLTSSESYPVRILERVPHHVVDLLLQLHKNGNPGWDRILQG